MRRWVHEDGRWRLRTARVSNGSSEEPTSPRAARIFTEITTPTTTMLFERVVRAQTDLHAQHAATARFQAQARAIAAALDSWRSESAAIAAAGAEDTPVDPGIEPATEADSCEASEDGDERIPEDAAAVADFLDLLSEVDFLNVPKPPHEFFCPITLQALRDPVVDSCGTTYERRAITKHLASSTLSPLTKQPVSSFALHFNRALRQCAERWASETALFIGARGESVAELLANARGILEARKTASRASPPPSAPSTPASARCDLTAWSRAFRSPVSWSRV